MEIKISALKFTASEQQIAFIEKKVAKLERFCNDPEAVAEVKLSIQGDTKKIQLLVNGNVIDRSAESFETAINACVDAMKEKLTREKEKAQQ